MKHEDLFERQVEIHKLLRVSTSKEKKILTQDTNFELHSALGVYKIIVKVL